jgi:hypothetical protein
MSKPIPKGLAARVAIIAALAIWLALWLIPSRYAMLDDCFIHLRYADFLVKTHTITYDGIHRSFGTSSPLYVAVLALLRPVFSGLIALLLTLCILPARSSLARALLCLLTFCLICPMGIRWLTDGMETSFQILFIVLLALITDAEMHASIRSIPRIIGLIAFGFLLTTLRIEGFSLIFLATPPPAAYAWRCKPSPLPQAPSSPSSPSVLPSATSSLTPPSPKAAQPL